MTLLNLLNLFHSFHAQMNLVRFGSTFALEDCPVIEGWTFSTTIAKQDICKSETGKYETKGKVYR